MVHSLSETAKGPLGVLAWIWGVGGVLLVCGRAVWSLVPKVVQAFDAPLSPIQIAAGVAWLGFMAYFEGYRGFQKAFAPRVVARAQHLAAHPRGLEVLLAPMFCMGLVRATSKRLLVSWCLLIGVTALVLMVRLLPQPWRGLVDAGVVLGLSWGCLAIAGWALAAARGTAIPISADLSENEVTLARATPDRTS